MYLKLATHFFFSHNLTHSLADGSQFHLTTSVT